jgi:hypothetical protein
MSVTPSPTRRIAWEALRFAGRNIERQLAWAAVPILFCALPSMAQTTPTTTNPCRSVHVPPLTTPSDANAQMEMREQQQQTKQSDFAAANEERKKQIADDTAKLLKLATELKTEVDKTSKDTLSLGVIRKADEIERLAHSVKEKMKPEAGGS